MPQFIFNQKKERRGFPPYYKLFSFDTETYYNNETERQEVFWITFAKRDKDKIINELFETTPETALDTLIDYMEENTVQKKPHYCFAHYLYYDLVSTMFYSQAINNEMFQYTNFEFEHREWKFKVVYSKGNFITAKKNGTQWTFIDSFAFFRKGLGKLADELNLPSKKMKHPVDIGKRKWNKRTDKYEVEYALADTETELHLAEYILGLHEEYDVYPSVSIAQLAQRIYKKKFMEQGVNYPMAPKSITEKAILSYHGGRNFWNGKAGLYTDCKEIDIVSAYPYAMMQLPCFCDENEFQNIDTYEKGLHGIFCVSGKVLDNKYPCLLNHDGSVITGEFKNVWVTSYEMDSAINHGDIHVTNFHGIIYVTRCNHTPPLSAYVREFFALKQNTPKTDSRYTAYKLLLNALYGKFIQCIDHNSFSEEWYKNEEGNYVPLENKNFVAGGLFNPFIASLITGHTRAYLHDLMHKYKAIHASTDSIKTQSEIESDDFGNRLGDIDIEIIGNCWILRNKLYLHYDEHGEIKKTGLHGFMGSAEQLEEMILTGTNKYTKTRFQKAMISMKSVDGVQPLVEFTEERELNLPYAIGELT
jgi:hypothetical protein